MTSGSDEERRQPNEPTFADVMNGFSFDASRSSRRRRWGRRKRAGQEQPAPESAAQESAVPQAPPQLAGAPTAPIVGLPPVEEVAGQGGAASVRPYTWTKGRTRSELELAIEALVSTSQRGREQMQLLQSEHRAVAELCQQVKSVAEVAALLTLPLGVARVLLGDMAELGVVTVHQTASSTGNSMPDLALMERVLSGLRRL